MPTVRRAYSSITGLFNQISIYHALRLAIQLFAAALLAVASPLLVRQLLLPPLVEYTAPLHFNFETCRDELAGVCSFPTAVLDFSADSMQLSPGTRYEVSIELVLTEWTINSAGVDMFQAVLETVDDQSTRRTFRRSCFANKHRGLAHRIYQLWWNLACRTIFFPVYFVGLLSATDDRRLEVSFTDRLVDHDVTKTVTFYVQLQNRFIQVESGKLLLRARFGLLRIFLYDYPIISSLLVGGLTYFTCLTGITLYWTLQAFRGYFRLTSPPSNSTVKQFESAAQQDERPELVKDRNVFFSWISREQDGGEGSSLHQRLRNRHMKD